MMLSTGPALFELRADRLSLKEGDVLTVTVTTRKVKLTGVARTADIPINIRKFCKYNQYQYSKSALHQFTR